MTRTTYTVAGMTCGHCVSAITDALSKLPGVGEVSVDLDSGSVTIASGTPLSRDAVRGAVVEAGYELQA